MASCRHHVKGGGLKKFPEEEIAHMRYMHETELKSVAQIMEHFQNRYTRRYILSIVNYELRANLKAKKMNEDQS